MSKNNFLLVDDNDDLREILQTLLRNAGFNVYPQKKLSEALNHLRMGNHKKFKYALVELHDYDHRGLDLIKQLRNEFPYIIVVGMSGSSDSDDIKKATLCGLHALVFKPFHLEEVLKIYEKISEENL